MKILRRENEDEKVVNKTAKKRLMLSLIYCCLASAESFQMFYEMITFVPAAVAVLINGINYISRGAL